MKIQKKLLFAAIAGAALFAALIVLLSTVDRSPIGAGGTEVGLSTINLFFRPDSLSEPLYEFTELLGYLSILTTVGFASLGLYQWIKRKSLAKVDRRLFFLAGVYVLLLISYLVFQKAIVNYRPFLMPGETAPEASFPSSHTLMTIGVMGCAILDFARSALKKPIRIVLITAAALVLLAMVAGRLLGGIHWATDILGGLLLGGTYLSLYAALTAEE